MAAALKAQGVNVQELFFSDNQLALGHEYQFDLDTSAGKLALSQIVQWLKKL